MTLRVRDAERLIQVKTALAEKYERKVLNSNSRPAQAKFQREATKYRQQAANLVHIIKSLG